MRIVARNTTRIDLSKWLRSEPIIRSDNWLAVGNRFTGLPLNIASLQQVVYCFVSFPQIRTVLFDIVHPL